MGLKKLSGKVALVTGSSRGIGRAVVERLSREGASVAINYFNSSDKAEEIVAAITTGDGTAVALQADVSRIEGIQQLFEQTFAHFGRLDILVNNAGVPPEPLQTPKKMNLIDCLPSMSRGRFLPVSKPPIEFPMVEGSSIFLLPLRE
jgi:NAD(P)-dependent dehydrogenase (short-subunit alcohol dehydrogenase family)